MNFNKNMGIADRTIRIVLALVAAYVIYTGMLVGVWAWVVGIVAVVFVLTSVVSFCPLYTLFGWHSNK